MEISKRVSWHLSFSCARYNRGLSEGEREREKYIIEEGSRPAVTVAS